MSDGSLGPRGFASTHWTLVARAVGNREALDEFLRAYLPALRTHLVYRKRLDRHLADDLLQDFVTRKVLEKDLLKLADPNYRLRSFLLTVLDNMVVDHFRRKKLPLAAEPDETPAATTDDVFDIAWAQLLVQRVVAALQADCEARQQREIWDVFQARLLRPIILGGEPASYEELVREHGLTSPKQAQNRLITAKKKLRQIMREVVGEYVFPDEIDQEISELCRALAQAKMELPELASPFSPTDPLAVAPQEISRLLESAEKMEESWSIPDMTTMWRHQLEQPLEQLFRGEPDAPVDDRCPADLSREQRMMWLQEVLYGLSPQLSLLEHVRRQGKHDLDHDRRMRDAHANLPRRWPPAVAKAMYYLGIAAALVRLAERTSALPDAVLAGNFQALSSVEWLDERGRLLLQQAAEQLGR